MLTVPADKKRFGLRLLSAWIAALFALVQGVALSHHATNDLADEHRISESAGYAENAVPHTVPSGKTAALDQARASGTSARHEVCAACLLSTLGIAAFTSPAAFCAPRPVRLHFAAPPESSAAYAIGISRRASGRAPPTIAE